MDKITEIENLFEEFLEFNIDEISPLIFPIVSMESQPQKIKTWIKSVGRLDRLDEEIYNIVYYNRKDIFAKCSVMQAFVFRNSHYGVWFDSLLNEKGRLEMPELLSLLKNSNFKGHDETQISLNQLFSALVECHKILHESNPEIIKITYKNNTSKWGPKVVIKTDKDFRYIFETRENFKTRRKKYHIASHLTADDLQAPRADAIATKIPGCQVVIINRVKNCKTLKDKFGEIITPKPKLIDVDNLSSLFEGFVDQYFSQDLTEIIPISNQDWIDLLPRIDSDNVPNYNLGNKTLFLKIRGPDTMHYITHSDEWGGNFLVNEKNWCYPIDFEDAIYCGVGGRKTIHSVGGDLSVRLFYQSKEVAPDEPKFNWKGLNVCGSMGRMLAALIQEEGKVTSNKVEIIIEVFLSSINKQVTAYQHDDLRNEILRQVLAYAYDWGLYWRDKERWQTEAKWETFKKIIKNIIFPSDPIASNTSPGDIGEIAAKRTSLYHGSLKDRQALEDKAVEEHEKCIHQWSELMKGGFGKSQKEFEIMCKKLEKRQNSDANKLVIQSNIRRINDQISFEKLAAQMVKLTEWNQPNKAKTSGRKAEALSQKFLDDLFSPLGVDEILLDYHTKGGIMIDYAVKYLDQWYFVEVKTKSNTLADPTLIEEQLLRGIGDFNVIKTHQDEFNTYYILRANVDPHKDESESSSTDPSTLIKEAEKLRKEGRWKEAEINYRNAIEIAEQRGEMELCAAAYKHLGSSYFEQEYYLEAGDNWETAYQLFCDIEGGEEEQVNCMMNLALTANKRNQNLKADAHFQKALEMYEKSKNLIGIADVHINLADIEYEKSNYKKAREYINMALGIHCSFCCPDCSEVGLDSDNDYFCSDCEIHFEPHYLSHFDASGDYPQKHATAHSIRGNIDCEMKDWDEASTHYNLAHAISQEGGDEKGMSDYENNLGRLYLIEAFHFYIRYGDSTSLPAQRVAEAYFRNHLERVRGFDEKPDPWYTSNNFTVDRKVWPKFPPKDGSVPPFL